MILGIDPSTYLEELAHGAKFFIDHKETDPLLAFKANGVDYMRIRVWVDPYQGNKPYLGGTCDLENFLALGLLAQQKGFKLIIDFHYSDFWCDPGKQFTPKAWKDMNLEELEKKVYEYTKKALLKIKKAGLELYGIQIGNEITNGMLWPLGKLKDKGPGEKRGNYPNLCRLLKAGIKASREVDPQGKIILHLERSADNKVYREFFDEMIAAQVEFDIIAASYYPYYHGKMEDVMANLADVKKRYGKPVFIAEVGYAFTSQDYIQGANQQMIFNEEFIKSHYVPYPITEQGQKLFIEKLLKEAKENNIDGIFYWEPLWIPGEGICWTSEEGQDYIHEHGKSTRNDWANQALYDYEGNALEALKAFRK